MKPDPQELHAQIQYRLLERLTASERRHSALLHNLQAAVVELAGLDVAYANPTAHRLLGYEDGDLVGQPFLALLDAEGRAAVRERLEGHEGEPIRVHLTVPGAPARVVLMSASATGPDRGLVSFLDVTDSARAEAEIASANALLRTIGRLQEQFIEAKGGAQVFDELAAAWVQSTDSVASLVVELDVSTVAPPIMAAWPPDPAPRLRRCLLDFACTSAAPDAPAVRRGQAPGGAALVALRLHRQGAVPGIVALIGRQGGYPDALVERLDPLLKTTTSLLAAHRVEAGRRHAEEALREQRERYALALEGSASGLWDYDVEAGTLYWSDRMRDMLGIPRDRPLIYDDWLALLHPADLDRARAAVDRHLGDRRPFDIEYRMRVADGSYRWMHAHGQARWDASGRAQRMAGSVVDVHARRQAQEQLREAKVAAEAASRAKSDFLANVSHEIRTPMNAILGMVEVLQDAVHTEDDRRSVGVVRRAGANLLALVDDLLDLSRIEAGEMEVRVAPFDLGDALAEVVETVSLTAARRDLALHVDLAPDLPAVVHGDGGRLRQVLTNLLGNATKFTAEGTITLSARVERAPAPRLCFDVTDTGIGIAAAELPKIFERFSQGDTSSTRAYGGAGLGLTIARTLARRLGGDLTASSTLGVGSTFTFVLPLGEHRADPGVPPAAGADWALLATPPSASATTLVRALTAWGWRVHHAPDGVAALGALGVQDRDHFGLALVDRRLPGIDAWRVVRGIRDWAGPRGRLLLLAAPGDDRAAPLALDRPAVDGTLRQPVVPSRLAALLRPAPHAPPTARAVPPLEVLIVEDNPDNRLVMQAFLRGTAHRVTFAHDGRQAVAAYRAGRFDVVLMDMQMPVMDGYAAARAIRALEAERPGPPSHIIALTASALASDIERCLAAGCDAHVSKPVNRATLARALAAAQGRLDAPGPTPPPPATVTFDPDPDLLDLLPAYLKRTQSDLRSGRAALAAADAPSARRIAHRIAGTGTSFGLPGLTALAREATARLRADAYDEADQLFERMSTLVERTARRLPAPT